MLDNNNARELAYVVKIDDIKPIEGRDRVECAVVGLWTIMVRKNQFKSGDLAIYFEIDSKTPEIEPFMFLDKKNFNIETQKYKTPSGYFYSQGLLMSAEDFGWKRNEYCIEDNDGSLHFAEGETRFLTKKLGIIYAVPDDNSRKSNGLDKYKKMEKSHPNIFKRSWIRWIMKFELGRRIMFAFFGNEKDKLEWPTHIAQKTDVERIQNVPYFLNIKEPFVATEKVDGSSFSVMAEKTKFGKINKYICSRNIVFNISNDKPYDKNNIYFEAYEKYNIGEIIEKMLDDLRLPNLAIQMEIYGSKVQKRNYSLLNGERKIAVFHIVSNNIKMPIDKMVELCEKYDLPHVPIIDDNFIFPDTIEELQQYVESEPSLIDGLEKEGIVFYDKATGTKYTKFVSPNFLMKYHA